MKRSCVAGVIVFYNSTLNWLCVLTFRLSATESLINAHVTPAECHKCGLELPGVCECAGKSNSCGRVKKFRASHAVVHGASTALSCYTETNRSASR